MATTTHRPVTDETARKVRALADAIEADRLREASDLIDALGDDLPEKIQSVAAEIQLNQCKWAEAADLYEQVPALSANQRLQHTLARNMAALAEHRPDIEPLVRNAITRVGESPYRIGSDGRGGMTVFHMPQEHDTGASASPQSLSPDVGQPASAPPLHAFRDVINRPIAKALCGIGDGTLLAAIAARPVTITGSARALVYVIEPDIELVALAFMLRDFSGPDSAIAQTNVRWFIGPQWVDAARQTLLNNLMLAVPGCYLGQGPNRNSITATVKQIVADRAQQRDRHRQAAHAHAQSLDDRTLVGRLNQNGDRPPWAVLVTSRHTTVIHHACRHAADALRRLGWHVHLLIEADEHEVMSEDALIAAVASHRPDLILTIDHLRREYADLPAGILFICWIQDNFENLTSRDAGRSLGPRDFVIGSSLLSYMEKYNYPADRCAIIPRLTHIEPPSTTAEDGATGSAQADRSTRHRSTRSTDIGTAPDMVYVSHHSATPEARLQWVVRTATARPDCADRYRSILEQGGRAIVEHYNQGGTIWTPAQLDDLLYDVLADADLRALGTDGVAQVRTLLFDRLNSTLFRQQALAWAVEVADERDLTVGIYGNGWEARPQFARFARGAIAYGSDLARLTRSATFNLLLEPYPPLRHQRLLDGLAAGGFYLCRAHQPDLPAQIEWHRFLTVGPGRHLERLSDAHASLNPADGERLHNLVTMLGQSNPRFTDSDPIARLRQFEHWKTLLDTHVHPDAMSVEDARQHLSGDDLRMFDDLLSQLTADTADFTRTDPVRRYRTHRATHGRPVDSALEGNMASDVEVALGMPPHFAQVLFTDRTSFGDAVDRFLGDPERRRAIAADQHACVCQHHSYDAGLRRVVEYVSRMLNREDERTALNGHGA